MSEQKAPGRPRQVTMAVVTSMVGALVLILSLFDTLGRLRTPETRATVDDFLSTPLGSGLGLETSQVIAGMRGLAMVSGALAAAMIVFAIYLLQRHKAARIGFTVTAALLLVTVPVAGLMPVLIAVGAVLVWTRPARDWYAGRPSVARTSSSDSAGPVAPSPAPGPGGSSLHSEHEPPRDGQGPPPSTVPYGMPLGAAGSRAAGGVPSGRPDSESGDEGARMHPSPYPPPGAQSQPYLPTPPRDPDRRPTTVTVAAVLTWLGAGAVTVVMVLFGVVLATGGDLFVDEFNRAAADSNLSVTREQVLAVGWIMTVFLLVWSVVAIVLAALAFRRNNAARIALVVSAVMAALLSLLMILSIVSLVTLLMAGATAVLLFTGGANEWYSRRGGPQGPFTYPSPPYSQAQPPTGRPKPW